MKNDCTNSFVNIIAISSAQNEISPFWWLIKLFFPSTLNTMKSNDLMLMTTIDTTLTYDMATHGILKLETNTRLKEANEQETKESKTQRNRRIIFLVSFC